MSKALSAIKNGIIDENPTFIQVIGTCPTLAVTTSAINGIGMGLSTMVVLICSIIKKNNSRYSTYPVLYRSYRQLRYNSTAVAFSIPS